MTAGHDSEPGGFWKRYVFSLDHKIIGLQYYFTAIVMGVVAAALSGFIRWQLSWPGQAVVSPETYVMLTTMHGTLMIFFVVSFALVSGFGNYLIPLHVGARDMAYPFLNMLSFWVAVPACLIMLLSMLVEGGAAAGWTFYPPLSAIGGFGHTLWLLSMALWIASFTMSSLNFLVTILNQRTRGMSLLRMPLLTWTMLVSAVLGILTFPALTAAAIMLLLDRHLGTSFFLATGMIVDGRLLPNQGGTPLLFQHLFWFLGHPEVYVLVLPAIGVAFEVLPAFARRPPFGYRVSIYSILVIAVLSMIVWGHHMFASGMSPYLGKYFSIATVLVTVPFSVLGFNLVAGLWRARIRFSSAMLFAVGLISIMGLGGLGGLFLGTATSDIHFHDSYFVVGHFHLMIGFVTFFGIFAGTYYWFPKMFGRHMDETLGRIHFWLTLGGAYAMTVLMHLQGLGGHLRRTYDPTKYAYTEPIRWLHEPITVAAFVLLGAQVLFLANFFWSLFRGRRAEANPWKATTLEWDVPSPPPHGNWTGEAPEVRRGPYEYGWNGRAEDYVPQTVER